ncbi:MAG TPA: hypothetical protein VFS09_09730 [Candidatus Eisenbacteria bacterium]|nr:hypothetical protein [Candidatus Eisenbacteria bacterium]
MNRVRRTVVLAIAALALLSASYAAATTVEKMSLRDLAKKSDAIVLARVEDETARYDANKEIYTYITLRVMEPVKGPKKDEVITIRQLGGTVDKIASIVPGTPTFKKGEEVVVFLTVKDGAGYPWVMGLQQGKYSVTADEKGEKHVRNEIDGLVLVAPGGKASEAEPGAAQPLQAFLDGLRTQLDEPGKVQIEPTDK